MYTQGYSMVIASAPVTARAVMTAQRDTRATASRPSAGARVLDRDVLALLDAAGPLGASDIAGGLTATVREVTRVVRRLVEADCLRTDEWGRFRAWGACRG